MNPNLPAWFSDARMRGLFERFPLPLALIDIGEGGPLLNERFERMFAPECLDAERLRRLIRAPETAWESVHLVGRDATTIQVRVRALRLADSVVLVFDERPDADVSAEIDGLRARMAELERFSATDTLTGAWNRAHFERVIGSELGRSQRFQQPLSVVLLDVDHFKRVNDTFGHRAGDTVLRELVRLVQARVRTSDLLFRWGGEEFVVLVAGTGYRGAEVMAEALRGAVEAHAFPVAGRITISAGVAEHDATETAAAWFDRADTVLYAAKAAGRNRVVTDRRGNSDTWASAQGRSALHLLWQEAYECGESTIDSEHKELFRLANALIGLSLAPPEPVALVTALDSLLAHIRTHFRNEEMLLAQSGYEKLEAHARAHARLLARAEKLREATTAGGASFGEIVDFLANDVVACHMFTADRDFYPLLAKPATTSTDSPPASCVTC